MKTRIDHLETPGDANISILQFLREQSSPDIEIKRIEAHDDLSVVVDRFFHQSPDYLGLVRKVSREQAVLDLIPPEQTEEYVRQKAHLDDLRKLEQRFKVDVLRLAGIFLRISVFSDRLIQARTLFEQGRFHAADDILKSTDLMKDQEDLLLAVDYWELRQKDLLGQIRSLNP